jgi:hypothetical protein
MDIFNTALSSCVVVEGTALATVKAYLVSSFLDGNALHQIYPLLELVGIGNALPETFYRNMRGAEARIVERCIVSSLTFLRDLLIEQRGREGKRSLLEHAVLEKVTRGGRRGSEEIVNVIAKYIEYDYNLDIPLVATQVLTLLCSSCIVQGGASPSFIGYFGDDAGRIVKGFSELASQDIGEKGSGNAEKREILCSAIFKFVCVVCKSKLISGC